MFFQICSDATKSEQFGKELKPVFKKNTISNGKTVKLLAVKKYKCQFCVATMSWGSHSKLFQKQRWRWVQRSAKDFGQIVHDLRRTQNRKEYIISINDSEKSLHVRD